MYINRERFISGPNTGPEDEICGHCRWRYCDIDDDWICINSCSDYYRDVTDYDFGCIDFEEREK